MLRESVANGEHLNSTIISIIGGENMEEWKAIEGYEGYYEVSSSGRVKSLERTVKMSVGQVRKLNSRIISGSFDTDGYRQCKLSKNGKYLTVNIHRLVA